METFLKGNTIRPLTFQNPEDSIQFPEPNDMEQGLRRAQHLLFVSCPSKFSNILPKLGDNCSVPSSLYLRFGKIVNCLLVHAKDVTI